MIKKIVKTAIIALCLVACRKEVETQSSTSTHVTDGVTGLSAEGDIKGFFLLNEGNMGSNKATLDHFDYTTGVYTKNIFAERNPTVVKELGDVGNDIQIYNDHLYCVINNSNLVEVMELSTATHLGTVSVQNCRYIAFNGNFAYVSSYAGEVEDTPSLRKGYVAKINLSTLTVVDSCSVGYQPEELLVANNKLYVANSGGYNAPDYDNTVSVIDLDSFTESKKIEVAINLHRLELDSQNRVWVSSRGNYSDVPSMSYVIDTASDSVIKELNIPNTNMAIKGDSVYIYSSVEGVAEKSFTIVNSTTFDVVDSNFIKDGSETALTMVYGIGVNSQNGEIFITDAKDYVTPGKLYCYNPNGTLKWSVTTGDIPACIAFSNDLLE